MALADTAQTVFEEVRARYRDPGSLKSTNKAYADDADREPAKIERRKRNADSGHAGHRAQRIAAFEKAGSAEIPSGRPSFVATGHALWVMNARILNCQELASMACFRAMEHGAHTWLMDLTPMDHTLCLIGNEAAISAVDGKEIGKLDTLKPSIEAYVVDVWLNTVCRIQDYAGSASAKLERWAQRGKRISWLPDGAEDDVWDVPNGAYRDSFLGSSLAKSFA